jgi:Zn-dependent alcohol dehydrogenase
MHPSKCQTANPNRIFMADLNNKRLERALTLGASDVINTATGDSIEKIVLLLMEKMIDFSLAVGIEPTANLSIKSLKLVVLLCGLECAKKKW